MAVLIERLPARSTGRALGSARAVLLVVEGFWAWYRRNWRSTAVTSVVQPVLFLLAFGLGFGAQVQPGEATGGLRYIVYLAPALLVTSAVNLAAMESTYPVLGGFKWQTQYVKIAASPITPAQIAGAQLTWVAFRLASSGLAYLAVAALLGALTGPAVLLSLLAAVLTGMAVSAVLAAYTATVDSDRTFSAVFRFVVLPMSLFGGAFFPVGALPAWIHPLAWVTPMWHGTELARGVALGGLDLWPAVGHLAYLIAMFAVGAWLCARNFRRRLST